jgi:hypothetical protein
MIEKAVNEYGKLPHDPTVKVLRHTACGAKAIVAFVVLWVPCSTICMCVRYA